LTSDPDHPPASSGSVVEEGSTHDGLPQLRRHWHVEHPDAVVLIVHGINEHSGRYEHVGVRMAAANLAVVGYDHRGFGGSGGPRGYVDRFDQYVDDVEDRLAEVTAAGRPVVLLGHSMGGLIALSYVLTRSPKPDLLVLSSPALGTGASWWIKALARPASRLVPWLRLPSPFPSSYLSRDPAVCEAFDTDPLVEHKTSARLGYELLAAMEARRSEIESLDVPTLVLHGSDDKLVPTISSEILEGLPGVERRVLDGLRHEPFNEPEGANVVDAVIAWIREQMG
jgi:acylglycerol lipase